MPQYTRVLCLGDSITYGARSSFGQTYPVQLERLLDGWVPTITIQAGVNGQRSYEIVERGWGHLGSDEWIKVCVAMMGTNDSKPASRTPHDLYIEQWDRLKRMCDCTDTLLYACEIPRINPVGQFEYDDNSMQWMAVANDLLHLWTQSNGVPYIQGFAKNMTDDLLADGIHPNNDGNTLIADRVAEHLRSRVSAPVRSRATSNGKYHTGGPVPGPVPTTLNDIRGLT